MHGLVWLPSLFPFPPRERKKESAQRKKERDYPLSLSLNPVLDLVFRQCLDLVLSLVLVLNLDLMLVLVMFSVSYLET